MDANESKQAEINHGLAHSPGLLSALRRLLRPLVRLLLAKGITYPHLSDLLKEIYVDVAKKDFALANKRQTDSRLSLLTGVHRKDVRRLVAQSPVCPSVPAKVSFGARVVARWCGEPAYLDTNGAPRPLPRQTPADGGVSFETLVADESTDIRARAVLDEWLRQGLVVITESGLVSLRTCAFVPEASLEEKAYYLGRNVHDHLAAACHNVLEHQPPFLERSVYSDGLDEAGIAELAALSEQLGMETLRTLNRRIRELKTERSPESDQEQRMTFGVYFFSQASRPVPSPHTTEA